MHTSGSMYAAVSLGYVILLSVVVEPQTRWFDWTQWNACSATCSGGNRTRYRYCPNPQVCIGTETETQDCNLIPCGWIVGTMPAPIWNKETITTPSFIPRQTFPPYWGLWSNWGVCTVTCSGGTRYRSRVCTNTAYCKGSQTVSERCNNLPCPAPPKTWPNWISGPAPTPPDNRGFTLAVMSSGWGTWSVWFPCSASCNGGIRSRIRACNNPAYCQGTETMNEYCNNFLCPAIQLVNPGLTPATRRVSVPVTRRPPTLTQPLSPTQSPPTIFVPARTMPVFRPTPSPIKTIFPVEIPTASFALPPIRFPGSEFTQHPHPHVPHPTVSNSVRINEPVTPRVHVPTPSLIPEPLPFPTPAALTKQPFQTLTTEFPQPTVAVVQATLSTQLPTQPPPTLPLPPALQTLPPISTPQPTRAPPQPSIQGSGNKLSGSTRPTRGAAVIPKSPPVDGGWTEWGLWSECTVTCGFGAAIRKRNCTNPEPAFGGRYCQEGIVENIDSSGMQWNFKLYGRSACPKV